MPNPDTLARPTLQAFGRLLAHLQDGGEDLPADLEGMTRLWARLKAEKSRAVVAEAFGLEETELALLDAALRDVERTTRAAGGDGPAERNRAIALLRLLGWLETVGQRVPALALPADVEALVSEEVGRKQIRALELVVRSLITESYGDQERLILRLREALSPRVVEKWQKSAEGGDVLTGCTFSELASLFVNKEEFQRYEKLYEDTPFLTLLKQRRKTIQNFLEDVRRIRNTLAHHKPVSNVQLSLLDLYYEEIVRPVQDAYDEGETKVDPSAYLDVSREELEGWYGKLREDVQGVKDEIAELRTAVLDKLGLLQADSAEIKKATRGLDRKLVAVGVIVVAILGVVLFLVLQGRDTQEGVEQTRAATERTEAAAREGAANAAEAAATAEQAAASSEQAAAASRDAAEASRATEAAVEEVKDTTERVVQTLEQLRDGFAALTQQGGVIVEASRPQEHYHNARVYEQRGDTAQAMQSYRAYFASADDLPFVDPHLRYQALLKLQLGPGGAREAYQEMRRSRGDDPLLRFASLLLLDGDARREGLEAFVEEGSTYTPAVYELGREYSLVRLGSQTLSDKRREQELLIAFFQLKEQGRFLEFYLDQQVAADQVADADERWAALSSVSAEVLRNPVSLSAMQSGNGWSITFSIAEQVREIFYRFGTEGEYQSTGFVPGVTGSGGVPLAMSNVEVMEPRRTVVQVKYTDLRGRENGPYEVLFDPQAQMLAGVKNILGMTKNSWVSFRDWDENRVLLYFSHLLSYRQALKEIRYGLDVDVPDKTHPFSAADPKNPYAIGDDEVIYVDVPPTTKWVVVQVEYLDGTESEIVKISR